MKTTLLAFALSFLAGDMIAQNPIPNAGFENWSGTPESPSQWGVLNYSIPFVGDFTSATKTTDAYSGAFAMALESIEVPVINLPIPGAAVTGELDILTFAAGGGFPIGYKPMVLKGYYKYETSGTDTASITVYFTKWNSGTSTRDTIGLGLKLFRDPVSSYTLFSIPLLINPFDEPDSAMIAIYSSSLLSPSPGSKFFVDELSFYPEPAPPAGLGDEPLAESCRVYPVPASGKVKVAFSAAKASMLAFYDITGREITRLPWAGKITEFNVSEFPEGLYLCRVLNDRGMPVATSRFSVIHH